MADNDYSKILCAIADTPSPGGRWEETAQLARGSQPERPLTISEVADVLIINASTVSRTVDRGELAVSRPRPQLPQTVSLPGSV